MIQSYNPKYNPEIREPCDDFYMMDKENLIKTFFSYGNLLGDRDFTIEMYLNFLINKLKNKDDNSINKFKEFMDILSNFHLGDNITDIISKKCKELNV